jgi:hypothetical protein
VTVTGLKEKSTLMLMRNEMSVSADLMKTKMERKE